MTCSFLLLTWPSAPLVQIRKIFIEHSSNKSEVSSFLLGVRDVQTSNINKTKLQFGLEATVQEARIQNLLTRLCFKRHSLLMMMMMMMMHSRHQWLSENLFLWCDDLRSPDDLHISRGKFPVCPQINFSQVSGKFPEMFRPPLLPTSYGRKCGEKSKPPFPPPPGGVWVCPGASSRWDGLGKHLKGGVLIGCRAPRPITLGTVPSFSHDPDLIDGPVNQDSLHHNQPKQSQRLQTYELKHFY